MANGTAIIKVEPGLAKAYNAAPKATQKKAQAALRQALRQVPVPIAEAPRLSKRESELFLTINRCLSDKQWQRMTELNEKIEAETATDKEHTELLRLAKRAEKMQVERLRAVIELAQLRKVAPEEILRQLELEAPARRGNDE
jgi:hypothetical protein